jgi:thioester reductase-like protein
MATILFTGFPGFLGSALLPRVLARHEGDEAVCLVQAKFARLADARRSEIERDHPQTAGRIQLVEGDITEAGLGLEDSVELSRSVREIYHLAAVYDLAVKRPVGMKVNVEGTRRVLELAADCAALERLQYVSTCYVSGRWAGVFTEDDLEKDQSFNNYYEETKFLAEVDVQQAMRDGLPATVYRPAIVVGDSRTGATQKYDGPYAIIRLLMRQPFIAMVPVIGDTTMVRVNLVPSDFVVDAITHLSGEAVSAGKVYNLADPSPLTVDELLDEISRAIPKRIIKVPTLLSLAKPALEYLPGAAWLTGIPPDSVDYFVHPTHYTCANTLADLAGTGIAAPPFPSYVDRLVGFVRQHPEISAAGMS